MSIGARLKHMWNAFKDTDNRTGNFGFDLGTAYSTRPHTSKSYLSNERSIVSSIYTRLSIDVAANEMMHVRLDEDRGVVEEIKSGLNECLTTEANIDQGARAFRQDIVLSLFDRGVIAIVPVDTTLDPEQSGGYDVKTLRVGEIVQWYPQHLRIKVYNDRVGQHEEVTLNKSYVAVVENPLYSVMNEPNSTLQRLVRKLGLLDSVDEAAGSGKLDLIIQLPYVIKSEARRQQAEQRRQDIEFQLKSSKYGIAYTDGTEKITQLNRPAENNLLKQIEYLTNLLYNQLGLTEEIMNGTANEQAMLNYYNRTIEPIMNAIVEAMKRTFLTKTARAQNQSIAYHRDPFKLVPLNQVADIADKFTRNEILTANEIRQIIGFAPSSDPRADKLQNSNMPVSDLGIPPAPDNAPLVKSNGNGQTASNGR